MDKLIYLINKKEVKRKLFYEELECYVSAKHGHGDCYASLEYYKKIFEKYKRDLLNGLSRGSLEFDVIFEIKRIKDNNNE